MVRSLRFFRGLRVLVFLRCILHGWMVPAMTDEANVPLIHDQLFKSHDGSIWECYLYLPTFTKKINQM